jgi:hypothetical protein
MFGINRPKLSTISCDSHGWRIGDESPSHRTWVTPEASCVNFQFIDSAPTFPFDLTELAKARAFYDNQSTELGGVMISVDVGESKKIEYLKGVFKYRSPEPGSMAMYYVGIIVLPFKSFMYQINTEALEVGASGMREASVMALGDGPPASDEPPEIVTNMEEFFAKSRAAKLRRIPADDTKYDDSFPNHPLSQVRRLQSHLIETLTFPNWLANKPKYRTKET